MTTPGSGSPLTRNRTRLMSCVPPPLTPDRSSVLSALLGRLGLSPLPPQLGSINEALSHTSAGLAKNHERLEFLGDAVLRLACAEFLEDHYPHLSVGERSGLRAQLVSDRWLGELAEKIELEPLILRGRSASADLAGRATVRAECCEALVGGIYEAWGGAEGGLKVVRLWLDLPWGESCGELLRDPHRHNWKSGLQEWSQGTWGELPHYESTEQNKEHGSPRRYFSQVFLKQKLYGEGWGASRRDAEQQAAQAALAQLKPPVR